jgi:hypothetical protein
MLSSSEEELQKKKKKKKKKFQFFALSMHGSAAIDSKVHIS